MAHNTPETPVSLAYGLAVGCAAQSTLYLASGTYTGNFNIFGAKSLRIVALGDVTIKVTGTVGITVRKANVTFENIKFDGNAANRATSGEVHTIAISEGSQLTLNNCSFSNTVSHTIDMADATVILNSCLFDGGATYSLGTYVLGHDDTARLYASGCTFQNIGAVNTHNQAFYWQHGAAVIEDCTFNNCSQGVDMRATASNCIVRRNTFNGGANGSDFAVGTASAIRDAATNTLIEDNTATGYQSQQVAILQGVNGIVRRNRFQHKAGIANTTLMRLHGLHYQVDANTLMGSQQSDAILIYSEPSSFTTATDNRLSNNNLSNGAYLYALDSVPEAGQRPVIIHESASNIVNDVTHAESNVVAVGAGLPLVANNDYVRWVV